MGKLLPSMRMAVGGGVLGWIITKLMLFTEYVDSVGGYENVVWGAVLSAALPIILDGLISIGALKTPPAEQQAPPKVSAPVLPDYDAFDDTYAGVTLSAGVVMSTEHFSQTKLECRGMACDCTYPGMSAQTMAIVEDLRGHFGPLVVNSAYRCKTHNDSIPDSSDDSYHIKARAIDVKSPTHSPQAMYDYLDAKYPQRFGFGNYRTFVHVDDRDDAWARKKTPETYWRQFKHNEADVTLT